MRFLLLDAIDEIVPGKTACGVKCWSLDNPVFADYLPGFPVVPLSLITEAMAQLSGRLIVASHIHAFPFSSHPYPFLSVIHIAQKSSHIKPGDRCILHAKLNSLDKSRASAEAEIFVKEARVCFASFSFFIGSQSDINQNPWIGRLEEYFHNLDFKRSST